MPGRLGPRDQVPFVRIAACVASDPIPSGARSGHVGDRFIALLSRDPIAGLISGLICIGDKVAWVRHAGNGTRRLDAVMGGEDECERPTAFAMLVTQVRGLRSYGRVEPIACLWLHIEVYAQRFPRGPRSRAVAHSLVPRRGCGCGTGGLPG